MHTIPHLKTGLITVALLAGVALAVFIVADGQQGRQAPMLLSQAGMLLPAVG
ncbi:hypothetical protein [Janthinobacterium sp. GW458P]|uniref:hypothetical protein n=1 Tax=Janthinobacterium sp. GW458P TaxID=1981504 RepID=UPI0012FD1147|nr:hypothetical protein [Janthinobacterium sp. GW458P]MBE3024554.1 hypothetical protein [Janthinobacterium sp. GW458P]